MGAVSDDPRCDYTLPMQKVPITAETPRCTCGGFLVPCHNRANGQDFMGCTSYHDLQPYKHVSYPLTLPALGKPKSRSNRRACFPVDASEIV